MTQTTQTTKHSPVTRDPLYNGMNLLDGAGMWYRVRLEMLERCAPPVVDVYDLAWALPHGSGIDGDWTVQVRRSGDVCVRGEYHAMNDGGYTGWRNFRFSLVKCKKREVRALSGSCAGKWQVTKLEGRLYLQGWVGGGDAADYLYDTVSYAISQELGIRAMESGLVVDRPDQRIG